MDLDFVILISSVSSVLGLIEPVQLHWCEPVPR